MVKKNEITNVKNIKSIIVEIGVIKRSVSTSSCNARLKLPKYLLIKEFAH